MSDASNENLMALVNEQLQAIGHKNRKLQELREILRPAVEAARDRLNPYKDRPNVLPPYNVVMWEQDKSLLRAGEVLGVE